MIKELQTGLQRIYWSVIIGLLMCSAASARAATLTAQHGTFVSGEPVGFTFSGGPGNTKDWVGIYPEGTVPGSGASTKYLYVDGTAAGNTAVTNGELTFGDPALPVGNWVAYFLENDGYRILAQEKFTVLDTTLPLVRTDKRSYNQGENITVSFQRGPGNAKDWIGIYAAGVTPGPGSFKFAYVDGTATGETGVTDGSVIINGGLVIPGDFVAYLLEDDSYNPIAMEPFKVVLAAGGLVKIQPDHEKYAPGQPITVAFEGGPGNATDWIGIYRPQDQPGPVPSTLWRYVNNTQGATVGLTSGTVDFPEGLSVPQVWRTFFLLNDGYTIAAEASFEVLDFGVPLLQTSKRVYNPGESISINFTNAPANAKDWIGIYPKGIDPSSTTATLWNYTDGTRNGTAGIFEGTLTFDAGLGDEDEWVAYLFQDDGYTVLAQEGFTVKATGVLAARIISTSLEDQSANAPAAPDLKVLLENRDTTVNLETLTIKLDDAPLAYETSIDGNRITATTRLNNYFQEGTHHTYVVSFKDSANTEVTKTINFTIGPVLTVALPQPPLFLETFDSTPEGSLPSGWTAANFSDAADIPADPLNLNSQTYANFTVVEASRFQNAFISYDGFEPDATQSDLLGSGYISTVVNGSYVRDYAVGKILFGASGYRTGARQILEVTTPDINLSGKNDVYLSYRALGKQNQDSIAGIEMSTDGGTTWSPVIYYLDAGDIIKTDDLIDLEQTYNTTRADIALFEDGSGGYYGAFLKAPLDAAVAAATQARADDNAQDGIRVERIRIAAADNQAHVQFRIFYAGTDSWYFALDDFGLYSIPSTPDVSLSITLSGNSVNLTWPNVAGYVLQSSPAIEPANWQIVAPTDPGGYSVSATESARFFRLIKQNP